jgi:hypothetical protein
MRWNDAIVSHFFRAENAGRSVFLYITADVVARLANEAGLSASSLIESINGGPPWVTRAGTCQKAFQAYRDWRHRKLSVPPYVAYLAVFVLAAGMEGDFAAHAYYARLRSLIGLPPGGTISSFSKMSYLWDDLETWSQYDKLGSLGVFKATIAGNQFHVGLPIAQTILSEKERASLPVLFAEAALEPSSPPPDEELARIVQLLGKHSLRPKTRALLAAPDQESYWVLLSTIADELENWSGEAPASSQPAEGDALATSATLRLSLQLRTLSREVSIALRCSAATDLPDDGLIFNSPGSSSLRCRQDIPGWSSPLEQEDGVAFNAAEVNWKQDWRLEDTEHGWRVRLRGARARIFIDASAEGLPNYIEVYQVPRSRPFLLMHDASVSALLASWFAKECDSVTELSIAKGLRAGWRLVSIANARDDTLVRKSLPLLSLTGMLRIRFRGGVKSSPGNSFFAFARPSIVIDGGSDALRVDCDSVQLASARDSTFALPAAAPVNSRITIVATDGSRVSRQSLFLADGLTLGQSRRPYRYFDRLGHEIADPVASATSVAGPTVYGQPFPRADFRISPLSCPEFSSVQDAYLLGDGPGQVSRWPSEPIPESWSPTWIVARKPQMRAIYCAASRSSPTQPPAEETAQKRRLWKELVWTRRKRIKPPANAVARKLWNALVLRARDAPIR